MATNEHFLNTGPAPYDWALDNDLVPANERTLVAYDWAQDDDPFNEQPIHVFEDPDRISLNGSIYSETVFLDPEIVRTQDMSVSITDVEPIENETIVFDDLYTGHISFSPEENKKEAEIIELYPEGEAIAVVTENAVEVEAPDTLKILEDDGQEVDDKLSRGQRIRRAARNAGLLAVAGGVFLFEQSWLNEQLRADAGLEILKSTNKELLVGMVVCGITMIVESACGLATAATISVKEGRLGKFNNWVAKKGSELDDTNKKGKKKNDILLGLAGGSTPVVAKRFYEQGGRSFSENRKTALKAAAGIALFSGAVAGGAGAIIREAADHGWNSQAQWFVDRLADNKTWQGLFILANAQSIIGFAKKGINKFRTNQETEFIQDSDLIEMV